MSGRPTRGCAYLTGGGIASLAAAVFLVRDAGFDGPRVRILEETETRTSPKIFSADYQLLTEIRPNFFSPPAAVFRPKNAQKTSYVPVTKPLPAKPKITLPLYMESTIFFARPI